MFTLSAGDNNFKSGNNPRHLIFFRVLEPLSPSLPGPLDDQGNPLSSADTCSTFQLVQQPDNSVSLHNANCACLKGNLYLWGGTLVVEGPMLVLEDHNKDVWKRGNALSVSYDDSPESTMCADHWSVTESDLMSITSETSCDVEKSGIRDACSTSDV